METFAALEAKNAFGRLLDTAQREPVTIEKRGRPVVVVLSMHAYDVIQQQLRELRRSGTPTEGDAERAPQDVPEEELRFEELLSELSATFVTFPDADVETGLQLVLQHIAEFLQVDQISLLAYDEGEAAFRLVHQHGAPDREPLTLLAPERLFPWCVAQLRAGEKVMFSQVDDLPEAAATDKQSFQQFVARSLLLLPLQAAGAMIGALSFGMLRESRTWPEALVQRVRLLGTIFASSLVHQKLITSEERYRSFIVNSTEGIWCLEFDEPVPLDLPEMEQLEHFYRHAYFADLNDTLATQYGSTREAFIGTPLASVVSLSEPATRSLLLNVVRSGYRMIDAESIEVDTDGNKLVFLNTFIGNFEDGHVFRLWGTSKEVTQLRETEQKIRMQSAAIEALRDGCLIIDAQAEDRPVIYANEGFTAITGYAASDILGRNFRFLQGPDTDPETLARMREALAQEDEFQGEILNYRKDGTPFWSLMRFSPVHEAQGALTHYVAILSDITERKHSEEALRLQREELAHVQRAAIMGELTAALAHEINQPLTAIRTNAQAAKRFMDAGQLDQEEIGEILEDIIADDRRATEVINRLQALLQKKTVVTEPLSINTVVGEVTGLLRNDALIKNVVVELDLAEGLPPVLGDGIQLQQVVLNLMMNGFDAMEEVPVPERILMIRTAREAGSLVQVSVRDAGVGFSGQDVEGLFTPFKTTKAKGLGMGLAISRSIIASHEGRIWAERNADRGATFHFTLPVEASV